MALAVSSRTFLAFSVTTCLLSCLHICSAESFLRASRVTLEEVRNDLLSELNTEIGEAHDARLAALEASLSNTYKALPKNDDGTVNHAVVRFVLHRFFMQRHGWFIKGLEPNGPIWDTSKSPDDASSMKEWVPAYLQNYLETSAGTDGINLRKLAVLAATLEDLVKTEAHNRLSAAYRTLDVEMRGEIGMDQVRDILGMYMVVYLVGGNVTADGPLEATQKLHNFQQKYTGYAEVAEWSEGVWKDTVPSAPWLLKPPATRGEEANKQEDFTVAAADTTRFVEAMGERFGTFNDLECRSLKETLIEIEGPKPGRVRLSDFYSKALYSHWNFNEKVEYLRTLGALDESDPKEIQVILPNYIGARPNCLEASGFYAICCRNECEDLMGYLEQKIGAPSASVERVVELVLNGLSYVKKSSCLRTAMTTSRRRRNTDSVSRAVVADSNGGEVPLHGRLFAQWMHHVFPRECPYPHEAGTTSPQTPDEWMKETGQGIVEASEEEMQCYVDMKTWLPTGGCSGSADTAAATAAAASVAGGSSDDLPWTATEELLVVHGSEQAQSSISRPGNGSAGIATWLRGLTLACVVSGVVLAARVLQQQEGGQGKAGQLLQGSRVAGWWVTLSLFTFPMLILTLDYSLEALLPRSLQLSGSAGEVLQVAACWGLLAAIVHRLIMEVGLPTRKDLSAIIGSGETREKYMV